MSLLENWSYNMLWALSLHCSMSQYHSTHWKIYEHLLSWHYDDLHLMGEKIEVQRSLVTCKDPQPAYFRVRSGICLSILKAQYLLTSVFFYPYSQTLPLINEGTVGNSFLNMTCNMRVWVDGVSFLPTQNIYSCGFQLLSHEQNTPDFDLICTWACL